MERSGRVFYKSEFAGIVWQNDDGYGFTYDTAYLNKPKARAISLTLPLRAEPYISKTFIPFFDGLIPEGWLLDITLKNWKLNANDRMELLINVCKDCIGAISVEGIKKENEV